ncbi:GNAT family N-acetyltransferase [Alsobacter sp. KACC 23698]|uniref:GNAT family N-acetyltransferase n=1 Tax=Alsobacter sp. KACC 23698 TaxID=3149229 RepID=A0AAU7JEI6_9HYPH
MRIPFLMPPTPSVRALRMQDAAAIADLHAEGFHASWSAQDCESMLLDKAVVGQGIGRGAGLEGFVLSRMAADEAEILTIAVARRRRGAGLGKRLLQAHLGRLAGLGIRRLFLEVDEGNAPARALYGRLGFDEVGRRNGYYRKPDGSAATALVLKRELD